MRDISERLSIPTQSISFLSATLVLLKFGTTSSRTLAILVFLFVIVNVVHRDLVKRESRKNDLLEAGSSVENLDVLRVFLVVLSVLENIALGILFAYVALVVFRVI
jgi:hypothetical protein